MEPPVPVSTFQTGSNFQVVPLVPSTFQTGSNFQVVPLLPSTFQIGSNFQVFPLVLSTFQIGSNFQVFPLVLSTFQAASNFQGFLVSFRQVNMLFWGGFMVGSGRLMIGSCQILDGFRMSVYIYWKYVDSGMVWTGFMWVPGSGSCRFWLHIMSYIN